MNNEANAQQEFDSALTEAMNESSAPDTQASAPDPAEPAQAPVAQDPAQDPAAAASAEGEPAKADEPAAQPTPAAEAPEVDAKPEPVPTPAPTPVNQPAPLDPTFLAQAIVEAQRQAQQSQQPEPIQKAEPKLEDFISADEKAVLDKYDSEWGEVSQAEQIRTKAAIALALAQFKLEVQGELAPVRAYMQRSTTTAHTAAIHAAHPDIESITGDVVKWVKEHPNQMVRDSGAQVLKQGNAQQVIGLVSLFKEATGRTGAAPATQAASPAAQEAPAAPTPAAPAAPDPAREKAAAATAAVTAAQRGGIPTGKDQTDFDLAWKEAIASAS